MFFYIIELLIFIFFSSSTEPQSTQCITDLKQRLLKIAIDKQPQILTSVDNHEIKVFFYIYNEYFIFFIGNYSANDNWR